MRHAKPYAGEPGLPLVLSGLVALGVLALGLLSGLGSPEANVLLERLLGNGMCRAILALACAAMVYTFLEYQGARGDLSGRLNRLAWMVGRSDRILSPADWQAQHERRMAPTSYAIFALPLLGFIGTVVGISGAIGEMGGLFEGQDRNAALAEVLTQLRFAFDTTFAGLVGVLPVSLMGVFARSVSAKVEAQLEPGS